MATKKTERDLKERPTEDERFWQAVYNAAVWPILLAHDGQQLTPISAAHLCADFADASLIELHRRFPK